MNSAEHSFQKETKSLLSRRLACLLIAAACLFSWAEKAQAEQTRDPYDVLYDMIMTRHLPDGKSYGRGSPSPLIWTESTYLLKDKTYAKFIAALDGFSALSRREIEEYGEIKRALMQRHLWAVFDWAANRRPTSLKPAEFKIQRQVAHLLKRLALSEAEIRALPNTIHATAKSGIFPQNHNPEDCFQPFFPRDLYDESGPWVCLRRTRDGLPAAIHSEFEEWRSAFLVFMRLPGDRKATLDYITKLSGFRETLISDERGIRLNPKAPQFPVGTQFALVERPLLISDQGELILSPLCYRIQLRAYLNVTDLYVPQLSKQPTQALAEFVMQPLKLMRGDPVMKPLGQDELHYATFFTNDPFERLGRTAGENAHLGLRNCMQCHGGRGILSVNSRAFPQLHNGFPVHFREGTTATIAGATIAAKKANYTWGLLEGLWRNADRVD